MNRIPAIATVNGWLLTGMFFFVPFEIAPVNVLGVLLVALWFIEGRYREKWQDIRRHPLVWLSWAYLAVHVLSLLWTENMEWGWEQVGKLYGFLLLPIFLQVLQPQHRWRNVYVFLGACVLSAVVTDVLWFKALYLDGLTSNDLLLDLKIISPWQNRIIQTPMTAMAIFIAFYLLVSRYQTLRVKRWLLVAAVAAMLMTLVVTSGRTGLLLLVVLVGVAVFMLMKRHRLKAILMALFLPALMAGGVYTTSDVVQERVSLAYEVITDRDSHINSSTGLRILFVQNSWELIKASPWLGVGVGDYADEYQEINQQLTPNWKPSTHPHNQFVFVQASLGVIGSIALLALLVGPRLLKRPKDDLDFIGTGLLVFYLVAFWGEDYWWRPNTQMMFVLLSIAVYRLSPLSNREQV